MNSPNGEKRTWPASWNGRLIRCRNDAPTTSSRIGHARNSERPAQPGAAAATIASGAHRRADGQPRRHARGAAASMNASMSAAGRAPVVRAISRPPQNTAIVGMDRMPKRSPRSASASVLTLTTSELPGLARRDLFELRRDHPARAAPRRPEVDDDRNRRRRDELIEVGACATSIGADAAAQVGLAAAAARRVASRSYARRFFCPHDGQAVDDAAIVGGEGRHTSAFIFLIAWDVARLRLGRLHRRLGCRRSGRRAGATLMAYECAQLYSSSAS